MKCPACEAAELVSDGLVVPSEKDDCGVPAVKGLACPLCGQNFLDQDDAEHYAYASHSQSSIAKTRLISMGGKAPEMLEIPRRRPLNAQNESEEDEISD